jgi:transcriptional regulator with XRE-family HTH domain
MRVTTNERLRSAIVAAGLTPEGLAEYLQVSSRSVLRWIHNEHCVPHARTRYRLAERLGKDELYLWRELAGRPSTQAKSREEIVAHYLNRGEVPPEVWTSMVEQADDVVELLVYAGQFWFDAHPALVPLLKGKAARGMAVRLLFGDPDCAALQRRSADEGIDVAARVRVTLSLMAPLTGAPGVEVRLHDTTLYTSLYRADDVLLVNQHVYGRPAAEAPVLHLSRIPGGAWSAIYMDLFERVWEHARPYGERI